MDAATHESLLGPGWRAVRRHLRPFVLIQCGAVALVVLYYRVPEFQRVCERLALWKIEGGFLFAAITTALSGAIFPEIAKMVAYGDTRFPEKRRRDIGFHLAFFAFIGVVVDCFYRVQALIFGTGTDIQTVAFKMLVDAFVFTPLVAVPLAVIAFLWREERYDVGATIRHWQPGFYRRRAVPLLIPNWCYWIPMVACVYALPGALQFCLFSAAFAAWSLILVSVVVREPAQT